MNGIFANYLWTMFWGSVFWVMWFSCENTNIDVSVFMFDLRMINMSSECEYEWYWIISACSTEYEVGDSFAIKLHILARQADIFGINQFTSR